MPKTSKGIPKSVAKKAEPVAKAKKATKAAPKAKPAAKAAPLKSAAPKAAAKKTAAPKTVAKKAAAPKAAAAKPAAAKAAKAAAPKAAAKKTVAKKAVAKKADAKTPVAKKPAAKKAVAKKAVAKKAAAKKPARKMLRRVEIRKYVRKATNRRFKPIERTVGELLIKLSRNAKAKREMKNLRKLYVLGAREVKVDDKLRAVVLKVPIQLIGKFRKISSKLIPELEKQLDGKQVVIVAARRAIKKPKKGTKFVFRPYSATVKAVQDEMLKDLVYPADIVGRRTRYRTDSSKLHTVFLDAKQKPAIEHKLRTYSAVFENLTHKKTVFQFQ